MILDFDPASLSIPELVAMRRPILLAGTSAVRFIKWLAGFIDGELERRRSTETTVSGPTTLPEEIDLDDWSAEELAGAFDVALDGSYYQPTGAPEAFWRAVSLKIIERLKRHPAFMQQFLTMRPDGRSA